MFLAVILAAFCVATAQVLPPSGLRRVRPGPTVQTLSGPVQGQEETYDVFRRIHTFKGIRYGEPPVGELRFRQAVPPRPWAQVHRAWDYGPRCPQITLLGRSDGEEDCLFLNIAAPTTIRSRLPVGVLIHGGGLQLGSGQMDTLGPEYINQENIVWVSLNYRLNVFGFLNVGDRNSPGNYGLKDMILALRWVRDNIEFFGGDPNDVTIIGPSGGAVAVHALVLSPEASGYFHKAIITSGSLFNYWATNRNPRRNAQRLAQSLQLHFTSTEDLVRQLRQVSVERLLRAAGGLVLGTETHFNELEFMPSIDPIDSLEPRVIPLPIPLMLRFGNVNRVPLVVGFNSAESLDTVIPAASDPLLLERLNMNPNLLVPLEWNIEPGSPRAQEVIAAFRSLYFGGAQTITADMALQWSDYVSDRLYVFGISKLARLHRPLQPVFYYRFSFSGALSFGQRGFGLSDYPGAMHGDDTFYLYRMNRAVTPVRPGDEAFTVQSRFVRLWTNFIRYGHPTPSTLDPLIQTAWPQMTTNEEFFDINGTLTSDVRPFRSRLDIWHAFDQRFNP
jgi:carboxylesterase type B